MSSIDLDFTSLHQRHAELGASRSTVYLWRKGTRPRWKFMRSISTVLNLPLPEVIKIFWGECIEDPCPCGCGGKKTYPKNPNAQGLDIEISCKSCKRTRTHRSYEKKAHRDLCVQCGHSFYKIEFTCVGYRIFNKKGHADKCRGNILLLPGEANRLEWVRKHTNPNSAFNLRQKQYRCRYCSAIQNNIKSRIQRLRTLFDGKRQNLERIRSKERLIALEREFGSELNARAVRKMRAVLHKAQKSPNWKRPGGTTTGNLLKNWARPIKELPKSVRFGLCEWCHTWIIQPHGKVQPRFHCECWKLFMRSSQGKQFRLPGRPGLKPILLAAEPGRPKTEESVRVSFAWLVQNCIEGNIYVTAKSEIWHQALKELGRSLNNRTFEKWIKPIRVREVTGDAISLQVPNKSFSNRLEKFFLGRISKALSLVAQRDLKVSLVTDKTNCESFPQSYGDIAKKYHVDRWTVEDKIEAFVRKLPNPVLLHSHAQRMVAAIVEGLKARDRVVAAMSAETGQ